MKLYATIYDLSFQTLTDREHARLDFYAKLTNGQMIYLAEIGPIKDLSKKFGIRIGTGKTEDLAGFKDRSCELIQDSNGVRFGRFTDLQGYGSS